MTSSVANGSWKACIETLKGIVTPDKELSFYDQVEFVRVLLLGEQAKCQGYKQSIGDSKNKN